MGLRPIFCHANKFVLRFLAHHMASTNQNELPSPNLGLYIDSQKIDKKINRTRNINQMKYFWEKKKILK